METTSKNNMAIDIIELAKQVMGTEVEAIQQMALRLNKDFKRAVEIIFAAQGRVVVVGMGKSGIIGRKIAATLASTGTASFFVHPGEAFHGDLGMIKGTDVVLMISNSGETEELVRILPFMQHQKNRVIAMTGKIESTLSRHADVTLDVTVPREACNNNLAPTSSTTATLVMGDALAVVLSSMRGFQPEDFARFHPGGNLGRRLLSRVKDIMHRDNLPVCTPQAIFKDIIHIINKGRLGLVLVMQNGELRGVITDGDIRRAFESAHDLKTIIADQIMSANPKIIGPNDRLVDAENKMRAFKINALVVQDENKKVVGVLQIYDFGNDQNIS